MSPRSAFFRLGPPRHLGGPGLNPISAIPQALQAQLMGCSPLASCQLLFPCPASSSGRSSSCPSWQSRHSTITTTTSNINYENNTISPIQQHHRHHSAKQVVPTMFDPSLSRPRIALGKLFGHTSSRLRSYHSSSWLATTAEAFSHHSRDENSHHLIYDTSQQHVVTETALDFRTKIPPRSWDSHMHILDPRFPLSPSAVYTPSPTAPTTLKHARHFESDVGLENVVLVQPSIYGYDNSCLLDALRLLGPGRARGVVAFEDPATWAFDNEDEPAISSSSSDNSSTTTLTDLTTSISHQTLQDWHQLGVRGVRINLQSAGDRQVSPDSFRALLQRYIDVVRPLGWVVQVYIPMDMMHILEPLVMSNANKGVKLCVDHMGHPHISRLAEYQATHNPYTIPGFDALVRLLDTGKVYVKLSAAYRFSTETMTAVTTTTTPTIASRKAPVSLDAVSHDVWPIATELLQVAGRSRVVFATDWPHTRFDGLDIRPWMQSVVDMCAGDAELVERVFRGNAEELWSVER
ncbi:amidohydrolase family protein [Microdochium nivale]|nr:amidohydrolase family protein [Microdochium nivale]